MTWAITASVGGALAGSAITANATRSAGSQAAAATTQASQAQIAEAQRQFDTIRQLLAPYTEAGTGALTQQQALLGLGPEGSQAAAIRAIEMSPEFAAITQQGENAILQNASATGGLRGGNIQTALAQYRPNVLSDLIQRRFTQLGGLSQLGQSSAAGVGNAVGTTGSQISSALGNIGTANAGAALASGQAMAGIGQDISRLGGFLGSQFAKPAL